MCVGTPELRTRYQVQCNLPHVSVASGLTVLHTNHGTGTHKPLPVKNYTYLMFVSCSCHAASDQCWEVSWNEASYIHCIHTSRKIWLITCTFSECRAQHKICWAVIILWLFCTATSNAGTTTSNACTLLGTLTSCITCLCCTSFHRHCPACILEHRWMLKRASMH